MFDVEPDRLESNDRAGVQFVDFAFAIIGHFVYCLRRSYKRFEFRRTEEKKNLSAM